MNAAEKLLKKDLLDKIEGLPPRDIKELYDYVVFLEMKDLIPQIDSDQLYFWTKKWQKMEKEASEDIKAGNVSGPYNSVKDLIKNLRK
jgi:hypothetical protein